MKKIDFCQRDMIFRTLKIIKRRRNQISIGFSVYPTTAFEKSYRPPHYTYSLKKYHREVISVFLCFIVERKKKR